MRRFEQKQTGGGCGRRFTPRQQHVMAGIAGTPDIQVLNSGEGAEIKGVISKPGPYASGAKGPDQIQDLN